MLITSRGIKYAFGITTGGLLYMPSFMMIGSDIQAILTQKQHGDLIFLLFLVRKVGKNCMPNTGWKIFDYYDLIIYGPFCV
jgi:hypothetical protein